MSRACSAQTNVPPPTIANANAPATRQAQPRHGRPGGRARDLVHRRAQPLQVVRVGRLRPAGAAQQRAPCGPLRIVAPASSDRSWSSRHPPSCSRHLAARDRGSDVSPAAAARCAGASTPCPTGTFISSAISLHDSDSISNITNVARFATSSRLRARSASSRCSRRTRMSSAAASVGGPLVLAAARQHLVGPAAAPAVVRGDAHADAEQPGRDARAAIERVQPPVHDHEDVLRDVVEIRRMDAEPLQAEPDEARVLTVDRAHLQRRRLARVRAAGTGSNAESKLGISLFHRVSKLVRGRLLPTQPDTRPARQRHDWLDEDSVHPNRAPFNEKRAAGQGFGDLQADLRPPAPW